jgi:hypothetical protein
LLRSTPNVSSISTCIVVFFAIAAVAGLGGACANDESRRSAAPGGAADAGAADAANDRHLAEAGVAAGVSATAQDVSSECWAGTECQWSGGNVAVSATAMTINGSACQLVPDAAQEQRAGLQKLIDIASCESRRAGARPVTLRLAKGTYQVKWQNPGWAGVDFASLPGDVKVPWGYLQALKIQGSRNLTIDGGGATLLFTNAAIGAFDVVSNENLTLTNFTQDYTYAPFSQGTVEATEPSRLVMTLDPGFPPPDNVSLYMNANVLHPQDLVPKTNDDGAVERDASGRIVYTQNHWYLTDASFMFVARGKSGLPMAKMPIWLPHREGCGPMAERIGTSARYYVYPQGKEGTCLLPGATTTKDTDFRDFFATNGFEPGARVVLVPRSSRFYTVIFRNNVNVTLSDLNVYASPGGSQFSWRHNDGVVKATRIMMIPKPGTGRLMSINGDGFNTAYSNRARFEITNSTFELNGDDVVNLKTQGQPLNSALVPASTGRNQIRLPLANPWYLEHFRAGDHLTFNRDSDGAKLMTPAPVTVEKIVNPCSDDARMFCIVLAGGAKVPEAPAGETVYVFNESVASAGSYFGHNRIINPRGAVTVSSPETTIEFNTADVVTWFVQIPLDLHWSQGPTPHSITVNNNIVKVVNTADFISPGTIVAYQRGKKDSGLPISAAPPSVRDIHHLVFRDNNFNNLPPTVTAIRTPNARPPEGSFFIHQDKSAARPIDAQPYFRKATGPNRYCALPDRQTYMAAGGSVWGPYVAYDPAFTEYGFDGPCPVQ